MTQRVFVIQYESNQITGLIFKPRKTRGIFVRARTVYFKSGLSGKPIVYGGKARTRNNMRIAFIWPEEESAS